MLEYVELCLVLIEFLIIDNEGHTRIHPFIVEIAVTISIQSLPETCSEHQRIEFEVRQISCDGNRAINYSG